MDNNDIPPSPLSIDTKAISKAAADKSDVFILPQLHPFLKIHAAPKDHEGAPQWTLYQPISHKFYKIGWVEFECLSRFHRYQDAAQLLHNIKIETGLDVSLEDLGELLKFLKQEGLTAHSVHDAEHTQTHAHAQKPKPLLQRLMHGYLYFTVKLVRPQRFLSVTYPVIKPLLSPSFKYFMMFLGLIALFITLPRLDEFLGTFTDILSMRGALLTALLYFVIKIIHELGHAYTATKYNVPIPHMGVAFIVLYPVLYTEATGSWRLTSQKARAEIGLAGVKTELFLAVFALFAWHLSDPGLGQMAAFSVVMISLIGSLFINLNPLMRFDGYYVLSDLTQIDNLHSVAIDYGRSFLRRHLLGFADTHIHQYAAKTEKYLTIFGISLLIYRFFLFLGIALLVYVVFMKPLGLLAMIFELTWFIGLPIWKEIKYCWQHKSAFSGSWRFRSFLGVCAMALIYICVPLPHSVSIPAVMIAPHQDVYSSQAVKIEKLHVKNGQKVEKGALLAELIAEDIEQNLETMQQRLQTLSMLKRRDQTNVDLFRSRRATIDEEINAAQIAVNAAQTQKQKLQIYAAQDGIVQDISPDIYEGRIIGVDHLLMRIVDTNKTIIRTYAAQQNLDVLTDIKKAYFRPHYALLTKYDFTFDNTSNAQQPVNVKEIEYAGLSSLYGGDIPSQYVQDADARTRVLEPINALYRMEFTVQKQQSPDVFSVDRVIYGQVRVASTNYSFLRKFWQDTHELMRRELPFN